MKMNSKTAIRLILLVLVAAIATACGRDEPEATSVPFTPTFTPMPIVASVDTDLEKTDEGMVSGTTSETFTGGTRLISPSPLNRPEPENIQPNPGAGPLAAPVVENVSEDNVEHNDAVGIGIRAGGKTFDLAAAAVQLGVTEGALQAALGDPTQGRPDFAAVAQELGVTEEYLIAALGLSAGRQRTGGGKRSNGEPPAESP